MWQSGSCCHIVLPPFIIPVLNFPQEKIGKQYLHRPTFPHIWWFPEMVVPNNHRVFLLKMIILGCFWGYHHLRKHPFCVGKKKTTSCEVGQPTSGLPLPESPKLLSSNPYNFTKMTPLYLTTGTSFTKYGLLIGKKLQANPLFGCFLKD